MISIQRKFTLILMVLLLSTASSSVFSIQKDLDIAIDGYDVVAYFTEGKAQKGASKYMVTHQNAIYQFTSNHHRTLFLQNPDKYLPQFDGYCAYGVTFAQKIKADPTVWKIVNNKLYFNTNQKFLEDWSKDVLASIAKGNEEWELIKDVPPNEL